ncbi:MAG: type II toxin-antitoxin system RelB/DinJ family antitoxin [Dehalobacterium sp.]
MAKSASMYIRIDPKVKADVEAIYSRYGMSITDAINIFLYESRNVGGLPFDSRPSVPNAKTLAAMQEVEDMISGKTPKNSISVDNFMKEMDA